MTSNIARCELRPFQATNEYDATEKGKHRGGPTSGDHRIAIVNITIEKRKTKNKNKMVRFLNEKL